jgi:hypothetical protein
MKKGIILIISFVIFTSCSFAFDDGDFQYWNAETISWKINEEWKAKLEEEFRFGDDAGILYYQHSDLGVTYTGLAKWLDVGVNYRHVFEEKDHKWKQENRPHFNGSFKWELGDFDLSNRGRFEYRNREDAENYWRFRDKFTVKLPGFTRFQFQPYIADEIFYDFDEETFDRNRLYGGFSFKLCNHLNAEIFYLHQSSKKDNKWSDAHVLGTKLKLVF